MDEVKVLCDSERDSGISRGRRRLFCWCTLCVCVCVCVWGGGGGCCVESMPLSV